MKKFKKLLAVLASTAIVLINSLTPLYAATYVANNWVTSNYMGAYGYKYMYTAHIQHNNGVITSAGNLSFANHNCVAPYGTNGCAISTHQISSFLHSANMAVTYNVGVDVSANMGFAGYQYIGSTTDTITAVPVTRRSLNGDEKVEFRFIVEPGKELHYDAEAAARFAEQQNGN